MCSLFKDLIDLDNIKDDLKCFVKTRSASSLGKY